MFSAPRRTVVAGGTGLADADPMDLIDATKAWPADGFVVLPGFLPTEELTSAVPELDLMFPSADGFHDGTDPRRERFLGDEFAGIDTFPFTATHISRPAVRPRVLAWPP